MILSSSSSTGTAKPINQIIPGYNGYENSVNRKISDQEIRSCMVDMIDKIVVQLTDLPAAMLEEDQKRLSELSQSTRRKLVTISASLRAPTYTGTAFFSLDKISEKRLERIYKHECAMLDGLDGIKVEINTLLQHHIEKALFEDHFLHITDFIDNFNQALFERESLILGNQF